MTEWRKSSHSGGVNDEACVELGRMTDAAIGIRDSKDPHGPKLALPARTVAELFARVKSSEFDL
ncbi:MAG TPA: DUF397 domain-containing protein [Streptosporangiaceae bacterium]|nr:DUF397 domain-containing protein [Streptosporangiaceae bacterium]